MTDKAIRKSHLILANLDRALIAMYAATDEAILLAAAALLAKIIISDPDAGPRQRLRHAQRHGLDARIALFVVQMLEANTNAISRINASVDVLATINYDQIRIEVLLSVGIDIRGGQAAYAAASYTRRTYRRATSDRRLKEAIAREIKRGIKAGEDAGLLAKRIQKVSRKSQTSARTTARTEFTRVVNYMRYAAMLDAEKRGVKIRKIWHHNPNVASPREWHEDQEGERKRLSEPFSNGLMYPGDPNAPPEEVINCHCYLGAEITA